MKKNRELVELNAVKMSFDVEISMKKSFKNIEFQEISIENKNNLES